MCVGALLPTVGAAAAALPEMVRKAVDELAEVHQVCCLFVGIRWLLVCASTCVCTCAHVCAAAGLPCSAVASQTPPLMVIKLDLMNQDKCHHNTQIVGL